jgi:hypothetical protein
MNTMATKDNYTCVGCGLMGLYQGSVTMVGGYVALLCQECRNAWHVYINKHQTLDALRTIEVKIQTIYLMCADGTDRHEQVLALEKMRTEMLADLFNESAAWIAARKQED